MPWSALLNRGRQRVWDYLPRGSRRYLTRRGRTAIYLACQVLELGPGDHVVAPAFNCGSELDPIVRSGARVVLYGVDRSCRFEIEEIESLLGPRVRAVYVTHYWGFLQPLRRLSVLCRRRGIALIEDCALALFSRGPDGPAGSVGDMAVFSFAKSLPVPDGGALIVNDPQLGAPPDLAGASLVQGGRALRGLVRAWLVKSGVHGADHYLDKHYVQHLVGRERTPCRSDERPGIPGDFYFQADDKRHISCASHWLLNNYDVSSLVRSQRDNYKVLVDLVRDVPGLRPVYESLPEGTCPLVVPVLVDERDRVCVELNRRGISAVPWWYGYHAGMIWDRYRDACYLKDHLLALRINMELTRRAMRYTAEVLRAACGQDADVRVGGGS